MTPSPLSVRAFASRLSETFPVLMREILRHENNYLSRGDITPPQFFALLHLSRQGSCCMHELADHMNVALPSATGLVDRLARQGLVMRKGCREDRRMVFVAITPKGKMIFKQILAQKRRGIAQVFGTLSFAERGRYLELIEKMVKRLSLGGRKEAA